MDQNNSEKRKDILAGMLYGAIELRKLRNIRDNLIESNKEEYSKGNISREDYLKKERKINEITDYGEILLPLSYQARVTELEEKVQKSVFSEDRLKRLIKKNDLTAILYIGLRGGNGLFELIHPEIRKKIQTHEEDLEQNKDKCYLDNILRIISENIKK